MSYIEFNKVTKLFSKKLVVQDISFEIAKSEFISFLGPSGCGKTTCLRMLAGLEKNDFGQINVDSKIYSNPSENFFIPPEKRQLGMVFQSYAVWPHMTVFENVAFPLKMAGLSEKERMQEVRFVLEIVELDKLSNRYSHELSGGQQQRVALARGLVMKPKALLLDEPLSNLDTKLRQKMRKDIKEIQKKLGLTMIYVTHDQTEARTMSDRIFIMNHGKIEQMGTYDEILKNPNNQFVSDFMNTVSI